MRGVLSDTTATQSNAEPAGGWGRAGTSFRKAVAAALRDWGGRGLRRAPAPSRLSGTGGGRRRLNPGPGARGHPPSAPRPRGSSLSPEPGGGASSPGRACGPRPAATPPPGRPHPAASLRRRRAKGNGRSRPLAPGCSSSCRVPASRRPPPDAGGAARGLGGVVSAPVARPPCPAWCAPSAAACCRPRPRAESSRGGRARSGAAMRSGRRGGGAGRSTRCWPGSGGPWGAWSKSCCWAPGRAASPLSLSRCGSSTVESSTRRRCWSSGPPSTRTSSRWAAGGAPQALPGVTARVRAGPWAAVGAAVLSRRAGACGAGAFVCPLGSLWKASMERKKTTEKGSRKLPCEGDWGKLCGNAEKGHSCGLRSRDKH